MWAFQGSCATVQNSTYLSRLASLATVLNSRVATASVLCTFYFLLFSPLSFLYVVQFAGWIGPANHLPLVLGSVPNERMNGAGHCDNCDTTLDPRKLSKVLLLLLFSLGASSFKTLVSDESAEETKAKEASDAKAEKEAEERRQKAAANKAKEAAESMSGRQVPRAAVSGDSCFVYKPQNLPQFSTCVPGVIYVPEEKYVRRLTLA